MKAQRVSGRSRRFGFFLVAAAAMLAMSGCSSSGTPNGASSAGASSPGSAACAPESGTAAGKKIVYIMAQTGVIYYDKVSEGLQKASKQLGFQYSAVGPDTAGATTQIPFLQQAIVDHVDAIAIQVNDNTALLPLLKQAKAAGILLLSVNITTPKDIVMGSVSGVNYSKLVAPQQLESLGKQMGYKGDFAVLSATTVSPFQKMIVGQMQALMKSDPKYKEMKLVKIAYGDDIAEKATNATNALLAEFPNLKAITAPTAVGLPAAAAAVEAAGKSGKIIITGLGQPNDLRKFVKSGTVTELQLWDPAGVGYVAGNILVNQLNGHKFVAGEDVKIPCYGTVKSNADTGDIYAQNELTTFTAANIDQYHY